MDLTMMIRSDGSVFLLLGTAFVFGALHGLEPGHAKTMMAAFVVAIRGTVGQAILLGLSATAAHSAIVWVLGLTAVAYGDALIGERLEPWLLIVSGVAIVGLGGWTLLRAWKARPGARSGIGQGRSGAGQGHPHHHHPHDPHNHAAHEHDHHGHHHHSHDRGHVEVPEDAHARAHAREIATRFADGRTTTLQVVLFGLTGGLIPCPAAITVLILCLNLDRLALGVGLVSAFSIGLAVTLVAAGIAAAVGLRVAERRAARDGGAGGRLTVALAWAPLASGAAVCAVGVIMGLSGWAYLGAAV